MKELTARQRKILDFIKQVVSRTGVPPSMREIGKHFEFRSVATVRDHLKAIIRKGYLERVPEVHRGLRLAKAKTRLVKIARGEETQTPVRSIPIVGRIAAGSPVLAVENLEGSFALDETLVPRGGDLFFLRVKGGSMIEAGIHDGDLALIRRQPEVENGEIAAVLIEDEATLKRFIKERNEIRLEPANPAYGPIVLVSSENAQILGKLAGIVRKY